MRVRPYVALFALSFIGYAQQSDVVHFSGIAINTTDPAKPVASPIELSLGNTLCTLTVLPPLTGSGICHLTTYEKVSGNIVFVFLYDQLFWHKLALNKRRHGNEEE